MRGYCYIVRIYVLVGIPVVSDWYTYCSILQIKAHGFKGHRYKGYGFKNTDIWATDSRDEGRQGQEVGGPGMTGLASARALARWRTI